MDTAGNSNAARWQLDKTISLTHIINTFLVVVAAFAWASTVDRRILQNEQQIQHIATEQKEQQRQIELLRNEFKSDLRSIASKLDRLIERRVDK